MDYKGYPKIKSRNSIDTGDGDARAIVQEKVDGSQLSVRNISGSLKFYNKMREIGGKGLPFYNTYISIVDKPQYFKEGFIYHGEAMRSKKPNTLEYGRVPKYCFMLYEIEREADGALLDPEEIEKMIAGTGIEYLKPIVDGKAKDIVSLIPDIMRKIESGDLQSCLIGKPEGIVYKVLGRAYRNKTVREQFTELNQSKKEKLSVASDRDFIAGLGSIFNNEARVQKAIQHLQENDSWDYGNTMKNVSAVLYELEKDLICEHGEFIKNELFLRFFPTINKSASACAVSYMRKCMDFQ